MNWINIRTETLRSPEFIHAKPGAMETWLKVLAYCCEQENGGMVFDCEEWEDRQWLSLCGVTKSDIENAFGLMYFLDGNLNVRKYPLEKQKEVSKKRLSGKKGGSCKTQAKTQASRVNGTQGGRPSITQAPNPTERNGKEGEGNRNPNGNNPPTPQGASASPPLSHGNGRRPTTETSMRIATLFNRSLDREWTDKEIKAYKKLLPIDPSDLSAVEQYTKSERAKGDDGIHRRDLQTFLNNFTTEVDRAKAKKVNGVSHKHEWLPSAVAVPAVSQEEQDRIAAKAREEAEKFRKEMRS